MGPRRDESSAAEPRVASWLPARQLRLAPRSSDSCGPTVPTTLADGDTGEIISKRTFLRIGLLLICELGVIVASEFSVYPAKLPDGFLSLSWAILLLIAGAWILSLEDLLGLFKTVRRSLRVDYGTIKNGHHSSPGNQMRAKHCGSNG